ncbi:hypothetical protein Ciccas_003846 [Cichlidogyrus casuarinus]|uniref:Uncharacterized protein n=1 Tax=Cichlidogyrus casuarinus TaxID=1844966 RepID=A0ABD2QE35_9PLAT
MSSFIDDCFQNFCTADSQASVLESYYRLISLVPGSSTISGLDIFASLKRKLNSSYRAGRFFETLDARIYHPDYQSRQPICRNLTCLVVGGGPCGLRCAIELALLGCRVVIVEKRTEFSRLNVLHLWPFLLEDLKLIGVKQFHPKFCLGSVNYISIRKLQCILLKIALILGVEFFTGLSFLSLAEPYSNNQEENYPRLVSWGAKFEPPNNILSNLTFNVIIGADGRKNSLKFPINESSNRLAIAITANFMRVKTESENSVPEICGMMCYSNPDFFADLMKKYGIELENLVYYREETNYFIFTASKSSLLQRGVFKRDNVQTDMLLRPENVNRRRLELYALDVAKHCTDGKLQPLTFEINAQNETDVSIFDFTRMYRADFASRITPFWPTGSGCGRGFLSSMDAAWMIAEFGLKLQQKASLSELAELTAKREIIYQKLLKTQCSEMASKFELYTLDPFTRYPNLLLDHLDLHLGRSLIDFKPAGLEGNASQSLMRQGQLNEKTFRPVLLIRWLRACLSWYRQDGLFSDLPKTFNPGETSNSVYLLCLAHFYLRDTAPELDTWFKKIKGCKCHAKSTDSIYHMALGIFDRNFALNRHINRQNFNWHKLFRYLHDNLKHISPDFGVFQPAHLEIRPADVVKGKRPSVMQELENRMAKINKDKSPGPPTDLVHAEADAENPNGVIEQGLVKARRQQLIQILSVRELHDLPVQQQAELAHRRNPTISRFTQK